MALSRCRQSLIAALSIVLVSAITFGAPLFGKKKENSVGAPAASQPGKFGDRLNAAQTITRENSSADKLRIEITNSRVNKDGKNVALVRIIWGDLDNTIKGGGQQYYSDWTGSLKLDSGSAKVVHKIQFDDGSKATSRPARKHPASQPADQKGAGLGRDQLLQSEGQQITWKAGVVGGIDGLLIKVTADTSSVSGTIVAGKFTVPFTITAGEQSTSQPTAPTKKGFFGRRK
jgi:hypothetical protein